MTTSDQLLLALQAYAEIQPHPSTAGAEKQFVPASTKNRTNLIDRALLPDSSLLLGLPVLLDLNNPVPGPILVSGDKSSGKTGLLRFLAQGSELLADPGDTQFAVLTHFPEEWESVDGLPNSMGIWPAYHPSCADLLSRLLSWRDVLPVSRQFILLLIDDLDLFASTDPKIRQDLQRLLQCGPEKHIWPVATVDPSRFERLTPWAGYFHTQIFGHLDRADWKEGLLNPGKFDAEKLIPGKEFAIRMLDDWLKFSIPADD